MRLAADVVSEVFRDVFAVEDVLPVSEWADRYAFFRDVGGRVVKWSTDRAPYTREIMDATQDPDTDEITVKMCEQMGKTETLQRIVQSVIDQQPTRIQIIYPNDRVAKNQIKRKLLPAIKLSPKTAARLATGRKTQDALTLEFDRTEIQTSGSHAPANVEGFAFGLSITDELDRCEPDTEDRVSGRGAALTRSMRIKVSTPTTSGVGIDRSFSRGDRRRFYVPCPHCFRYDFRRFEDLRWPGRLKGGQWSERSRDYGANPEDVADSAYIVCKHCDKPIRHNDNMWQLRLGVWVPEGCSIGSLDVSKDRARPAVPTWTGTRLSRKHRSYELTGLYRCFPSGVNPYGKMAAGLVEFRGNPPAEWWNRRGGLAHTPKGETADVETLKKARTPIAQGGFRYGIVPDWVVALVCCVDVQANHVWATVFGLGRGDDPEGQRCCLVWCESLPAPTGLGFGSVNELYTRKWVKENGSTMWILGGPMDSGHRQTEVWDWGRQGGHRVVVRGLGGGSGRGSIATLVRWTTPEKMSDNKTVRPDSVKVLQVNTMAWKQTAISMLNNAGGVVNTDQEVAIGGSMRILLPEDTPDEWIAQVTAEQLVTNRKNGSISRVWVLKPGRVHNHYLDNLVYFLAWCHAKGAHTLRDTRGTTAAPTHGVRRTGSMF